MSKHPSALDWWLNFSIVFIMVAMVLFFFLLLRKVKDFASIN